MFAKINLRILSTKERALLNAVSDEDLAKVKTLVAEDNVNINIRDSLERSPLMRTSFVADNEAREGMTKIFLRNGAEPNMVDLHGRSALMLACREENKEDMVKILMECNRTDPNLQDEDGNTALVQAIENENVAVVRTLLTKDYSHRVDVNVENFESKTAIVIAAKLKNKEICALLTSTGKISLSDVPNHLIEYLPEEFQSEADEAKEKNKESRSPSSKGTPTDIQGDSSHSFSPNPNEPLPPSPNLNPQTKTVPEDTEDGTPLEGGRIPPSVEDEKEAHQEQQHDRSTSSNIPTPQNVDNVDDTETSLHNDTAVEPHQQDSIENKDPKLEAERPASKESLKESPTGRLSRASSEDKVVQKLDKDDHESRRAENGQGESNILKEEESKKPADEMENGKDESREGVAGTKSESSAVIVSENKIHEMKNTSRKNSIASNSPRRNNMIHESGNGDDRSDQRRSSVKESTEDSQAKGLQKAQQSEDKKMQRSTGSLQRTSPSNNKTGTSETKDATTVEKQYSAGENSSTETTTNADDERKNIPKRSETRPSKDRHNKNLTNRSSKEELRKSDQGDAKSTVELEKSPVNRSSPTTPNQSISAASFTSEPPAGVQRSPEKPRGWTAPAVTAVPAAVNKWKKRAKERRGSKSHRKRPLRVEDQTPYVTKSGRVIYPNSVHDSKYEDIQEVRAVSRMSRMDMASQLMLRENADRPQTHSAHPRRDSRKVSRQGSKNTIA